MIELTDQKKALYEVVKACYYFGDFKMKDGLKTNYYINGQVITSNSLGIYLSSKIMWEELDKMNIDGICGEISGACPLIGGILTLSQITGKALCGYYIRKSLKENGNFGYLDVAVKKGARLVVVDDVLSSGKTVLRCKKIMEDLGAHVIGYMGIIDRMRGAREQLINRNMVCNTIFTVNDFAEYIQENLKII